MPHILVGPREVAQAAPAGSLRGSGARLDMTQTDRRGKTKKSTSLTGFLAATVLSSLFIALWQEFIGQTLGALLGDLLWISAILLLLGSLILLIAHAQRGAPYEPLRLIVRMLPNSPVTGYVLTVVAGLSAAVLIAPLVWPVLSPSCPLPTQLIVVTAADSEAVLREAADVYETERREENGGCRPVDVLVYAAGTTETVRQTLANGWELPANTTEMGAGPPGRSYLVDRSLGARPHYWIPESTVEFLELVPPEDGRVNSNGKLGDAGLDYLGPTRMTPLVWAVPDAFPPDVEPGILPDGPDLEWARPGLRWTSVGRLHGAHQARLLAESGRAAEQVQAEARFLGEEGADSSLALLCRVGKWADTVALVSEAAVYQARSALDSASPDCPEGMRTDLSPRYGPGLPFLDHPLVRVLWEDEEPSDLTAERQEFERFLLDLAEDEDAYAADGVYAGYRSVTGQGRAAEAMAAEHDAAHGPQVSEWAARFDPVQWWEWALQADEAHREASEPATILLAFDRSTSMASVPQQFDAARTAATTIIGDLRAQDRFGLWSYPAGDSGREATAATTLVSTTHRDNLPEELIATVEGLAPTHRPTPLREVIRAGVLALEEDAAPGAMLVVVTDGVRIQDDRGLSQEELDRVLDGTDVRVRIIAVGGGAQQAADQAACEVGILPQLTGHPRVECRDADRGRADESARGVVEEARGGR